MSWNEETNTLEDGRGRAVTVSKRGAIAANRLSDGACIYLQPSAPADLAAFGHACLAAAGEPVETTPAPFKTDAAFEDVQVGDRVRVTYMGEEPTEFTVTGVDESAFDGRQTMHFFSHDKHLYTIDILSRPEPVFPRTVPASEAHEHVGCRVTVEKDGATVSGLLSHAFTSNDGDHWHLYIGDQIIGAQMVTIPSAHPIILEAPADAGASVVGGA